MGDRLAGPISGALICGGVILSAQVPHSQAHPPFATQERLILTLRSEG